MVNIKYIIFIIFLLFIVLSYSYSNNSEFQINYYFGGISGVVSLGLNYSFNESIRIGSSIGLSWITLSKAESFFTLNIPIKLDYKLLNIGIYNLYLNIDYVNLYDSKSNKYSPMICSTLLNEINIGVIFSIQLGCAYNFIEISNYHNGIFFIWEFGLGFGF